MMKVAFKYNKPCRIKATCNLESVQLDRQSKYSTQTTGVARGGVLGAHARCTPKTEKNFWA